jgi:hypothetical protein
MVTPPCDIAQVGPSRHEHAFEQAVVPICWHNPDDPPLLPPQVANERLATTINRILRIPHFQRRSG